jgi:hypothetical protein
MQRLVVAAANAEKEANSISLLMRCRNQIIHAEYTNEENTQPADTENCLREQEERDSFRRHFHFQTDLCCRLSSPMIFFSSLSSVLYGIREVLSFVL